MAPSSVPASSTSPSAPPPTALLAGVRVIECTLLSPSGVGQHLADLGAEVIKVEAPGDGDYVRRIAWPIIDGNSLEHWHWNRGKRSVVIDLRTAEGLDLFCELLGRADALVEGMRPGALARRGLTAERLRDANPALVHCKVSGYGSTGPYRDLASHGLAFDALAGAAPPATTTDGFTTIPDHVSVGMHAACLYGALGVVSAVLRARATGQGASFEVAQADAAVAWNWLKIEGNRAYERPQAEVTGNPADGYARRPIGFADFGDAVRYQYYATADGHVLLMASERKFWRNLCEATGRMDLFDAHPGAELADHAVGNTELRRALTALFAERTTAQWMELGVAHDVPIAPVHTPVSVRNDPQVQDRITWFEGVRPGADTMAPPLWFDGAARPTPAPAPSVGQHTDEVLTELLGLDDAGLAALREVGAIA